MTHFRPKLKKFKIKITHLLYPVVAHSNLLNSTATIFPPAMDSPLWKTDFVVAAVGVAATVDAVVVIVNFYQYFANYLLKQWLRLIKIVDY
jgi:hypothetical protein